MQSFELIILGNELYGNTNQSASLHCIVVENQEIGVMNLLARAKIKHSNGWTKQRAAEIVALCLVEIDTETVYSELRETNFIRCIKWWKHIHIVRLTIPLILVMLKQFQKFP